MKEDGIMMNPDWPAPPVADAPNVGYAMVSNGEWKIPIPPTDRADPYPVGERGLEGMGRKNWQIALQPAGRYNPV